MQLYCALEHGFNHIWIRDLCTHRLEAATICSLLERRAAADVLGCCATSGIDAGVLCTDLS
jgi:hypothetical protein